jgi:hypothetical protein
MRGNDSCASAACHGDTGAKGTKGCEYNNWVRYDRHLRAYEVLLTDRSRTIETNYRRLAKGAPSQPERDTLCLRCHASDAEGAKQGKETAFADGVGCERCHGPAGTWLTAHYGRDWQTKSDADKMAVGFFPTKNLTRRAAMCVECHVGNERQEVDHDLLAAGHPRLRFELAAFQATMPPHWNVRAEKERIPDLEAKSWVVGQTVSARAAIDLLALHADKGKEKTAPWPEFTTQDCYACHHALRNKEAGYHVPTVGDHPSARVPGVIGLNEWYFTLLPEALSQPDPTRTRIETLRKLMVEKPSPNAAKAADEARHIATGLDAADASPLSPAVLREKIRTLVDAGAAELPESWDAAAQRYLALAAFYNALTDLEPARRDPVLRTALKDMAANLRYPQGLDSPDDWNADDFQKLCAALKSHLGK